MISAPGDYGFSFDWKCYGESSLEIELTKEILDNMVATGGLVITGQGFTLTAVILK